MIVAQHTHTHTPLVLVTWDHTVHGDDAFSKERYVYRHVYGVPVFCGVDAADADAASTECGLKASFHDDLLDDLLDGVLGVGGSPRKPGHPGDSARKRDAVERDVRVPPVRRRFVERDVGRDSKPLAAVLRSSVLRGTVCGQCKEHRARGEAVHGAPAPVHPHAKSGKEPSLSIDQWRGAVIP